MDSRTALREGSRLRCKDGREYVITRELARGGSSLVYDAFYLDNIGERKTVRIKECYPFQCNLGREADGALVVPEADQRLFAETKRNMQRAYQLGNEFFATDGLTNLTANTYNIYEANHTLYVVSAYVEGQELSYGRYSAVRDCIGVVKGAAHAIGKIHRKGFLYLDIKPGNILTLEGTTELIWLFDFDTVVPIVNFAEAGDKTPGVHGMAALGDKISYTKGFAALELQRGDYRHIGRHTDVYGIGALLFYLLFHRVPDAFDCEADAQYDFSDSRLSQGTYPDTLFFRLTDFFHHTLADYYLDRFSDMETVEEKLEELQSLADQSARYVVNSKLPAVDLFLGREQEEAWILQRLVEGSKECSAWHDVEGSKECSAGHDMEDRGEYGAECGVRCSFVVGMGGMGKSTLVRHCLRKCKTRLDTILYLDYRGSLAETICDDYGAQIHGIWRDKTENLEDYFDRKLAIMRELGRGKRCLLVIDNYRKEREGADVAFPRLLQLGWSLFFLSRDPSIAQGYDADTLRLGPIEEEKALLSLFAANMGRSLEREEELSALSIIRAIEGHTLVLELLAKQIGSPLCSLTLSQAAQMVAESGFSAIDSERVGYRRDDILYQKTIRQIIADLFAGESLTEPQRILMKMLALFGRIGIAVAQVCQMLELHSREDISILYGQGWIYVNNARITMHPVIEEVVSQWEVTEKVKNAANRVFRYLDLNLREEVGSGGVLPATESGESLPSTDSGEALRLAAAALNGGKREGRMCSVPAYRDLLYDVIRNMPYENEHFVKEKAEEYIAFWDHGQEEKLLRIYEDLLEILYEQGSFEEAKRRIRQMRASIAVGRSTSRFESMPAGLLVGSSTGLPDKHACRVWGRYYYILGGYYDAVLDGAYAAQTPEETRLVRLFLKTVDQAIHWLSLSRDEDSVLFLGECYRLKALLLIRTGMGRKKQIGSLLGKVRRLIDRYAEPDSKLERDCHMALAWYYTYVEEDYPKTRSYMAKAMAISARICKSELVQIDEQLSPVANILLEWRRYDKAEQCLLRCIAICERHLVILPYARRQMELLGHLLQVCLYAEKYDRCREIITEIDEKIGKIGGLQVEDYVPVEVRQALMQS